mmetsp:Transcript_48039/g.116734  ORF Transcript_48039/g.116734 Transcript_48039/m.116734 type:complete len:85 (-) Transcript_48039:53-307(-)
MFINEEGGSDAPTEDQASLTAKANALASNLFLLSSLFWGICALFWGIMLVVMTKQLSKSQDNNKSKKLPPPYKEPRTTIVDRTE